MEWTASSQSGAQTRFAVAATRRKSLQQSKTDDKTRNKQQQHEAALCIDNDTPTTGSDDRILTIAAVGFDLNICFLGSAFVSGTFCARRHREFSAFLCILHHHDNDDDETQLGSGSLR